MTAKKHKKPARKTARKAAKKAPKLRLTLIDYLDAGLGKVSDAEVARVLNVTRQAVGKMRIQAGIERPPEEPFDEVLWLERLAKAQLDGDSAKTLAKKLEVPLEDVREACRRCGLYLKRAVPVTADWRPEWSALDWTKGNAQIAQDLTTATRQVKHWQIAAWRLKLRREGKPVPAAPVGYNARVA